jgi:ankyrin repeat protein
MWAAADGHADVVRALIRAGADPQATLDSGFNPMLFAVRNGQRAVVQALIEFGSDINAAVAVSKANNKGLKPGTTPLLLAIENGHFDLAVDLLDAGADPNEQRRGGYTPLHAMTWVRKPLRGDGDPPPSGSGRTTSLDFVRLLVQRGADVNARHGPHKSANLALNKTGATPFLLAAETGDMALMRTLLELGADPTLVNADQCTPLLAATGVGVLGNGDEPAGTTEEALEVVRLLLELGADINAVDALGNTAMHGATYENRYQLLQFLAEHGARVETWNRPNRRGWTPLDVAYGHRPGNFRPAPESIDILKGLLIEAGVTPPAAPVR